MNLLLGFFFLSIGSIGLYFRLRFPIKGVDPLLANVKGLYGSIIAIIVGIVLIIKAIFN